MIFVPNFSGEFASVFSSRVLLSRSEQARGIFAAREYRAKRRFDFSEYTEECCSPFEFDMFTFVSATVRLE